MSSPVSPASRPRPVPASASAPSRPLTAPAVVAGPVSSFELDVPFELRVLDRGMRRFHATAESAFNRILPRPLWGVLNPAEYARTIDRFQAALLAQPLGGLLFALVMLWCVCTCCFLVLLMKRDDGLGVLEVLAVIGSAAGSIGSAAASPFVLSRVQRDRVDRMQIIAEQETASYNSMHRRRLFGALGGGGWRLEFSIRQLRNPIRTTAQMQLVVHISMKPWPQQPQQPQQRVHDLSPLAPAEINAGMEGQPVHPRLPVSDSRPPPAPAAAHWSASPQPPPTIAALTARSASPSLIPAASAVASSLPSASSPPSSGPSNVDDVEPGAPDDNCGDPKPRPHH